MFNLVGLTQGENIPSTRFRWSQYVDDLGRAGFEVSEFPSQSGAYPPASTARRPVWLGAATAENLIRTLRSNRFNLRFLQRNLISTLCTWEPLLRKPFVFDVDDAIFLGSRGASADRIARSSSLIICGNDFLANHFYKFGPVKIIPTAVDVERYFPNSNQSAGKRVVGWSGSSSGFKYLYEIESEILTLLKKYPDATLKIISNEPPVFKTLPRRQVVFEPWTPHGEVDAMRDFSIGIMPLKDDLWARGKCSFKMLTYMAMGIPVVVSPVGMNSEILAQAECGLGPKNASEWVDALSYLLDTPGSAKEMGKAGRRLIENRYARNVIGPKLAKTLREQVENS